MTDRRSQASSLWIIRHGKPDVPTSGWRVSRTEFNQYLLAYDQAGLSASEADRLRTRYQDCPKPELVLSSDLPRAFATAELFARGAKIITDPILREVPVQIPDYPGRFLEGRWPSELWWTYLRIAWFRGLQAETPKLSSARALRAIEFVTAHRTANTELAVVSHSGFLLIVVDKLHRRHAVSGPRLPSIEFGRPNHYRWLGDGQAQS